jgi:Bacteriophage tail sheath protein
MPEYLSPGVYVEEIDAGPKPIEGVSTSTAGAVGVTAFGPTSGKPELVTSFAEFMRTFGGFLPEPPSGIVNRWALDPTEGGRWWYFPLAVKGFFDNGGQRLFVKRVFSRTAVASSGDLGHGMISELVSNAPANTREIRLRHLINIQVNSAVQIFRGDTGAQISPQAGGDFTVTSYDGAGGSIILNPAVPQELVASRKDFVQIHPKTGESVASTDTTLTFRAKSRGDWGKALSVRVRPMVGATYRILPDPNIGGNPVQTTVVAQANAGATTVTVTSVAGLRNNDHVLIKGREYILNNVSPDPTTTVAAQANAGATTITVVSVAGLADDNTVEIRGHQFTLSNVTAAANTFDIAPAVPAGTTWPPGTEVRRLPRRFDIAPVVPAGETWTVGTAVQRLRRAYDPTAPARAINVWGASSLYTGAIVELDNGQQKETRTVESKNGDRVTLSSPNLAQAYYEGHSLRAIEAEVAVRYAPEGAQATEESFANLRLINDGSLNNLSNQVNTRSALVEATNGAGYSESDLTRFPIAPNGYWRALTGGDDRLADLSPDDFVGVDAGSGNRTGIQALEDIDEISICLVPGMWSSSVHSALIQHCEILKDRFAILDPQDGLDIEHIQNVREPLDTKYAALYYPWIGVRDPSVQRNVYVAPSGHMAGIYARVDVERGVHKAPANEVIRGITKIAQDITKREQDLLNPKGINALRFFPGRGNRVWGARVVTSDSSWKYINVRRLFIFVEESIDEGTQFVVFEPNDEPLWARVRQTITNFLTTVWRSGALQGTKPDEAFFVKCDRTTMTQDDIDNGRLICVIGIAPVKPAEFVIFRIQQKTQESPTT